MTRFDEVAQLRELEKKAGYDRVEHGAPFRAFMARSAPWSLEVLACFQPGDADLLRWMRTAEGDAGDGTLEEVHDAIERLLIRMLKAAEIMEGQE